MELPKDSIHVNTLIWCSILIGFLTGIISTMRGTDILGGFILVMGLLAMIVILFRQKDYKLRNILFVAFFLRTGLAILQTYILTLPDATADAVVFENIGWQAAQAWLGANIVPNLYGAFAYSRVIGFVYYLFGRIQLIPSFINTLLGILIIFVIYKITIEIGGTRQNARLAALIATFFPTLNLYSAVLMRENLISASIAISAYYFIRWLNYGTLFDMFKTIAFLLTTSFFHGAMIIIGAVYALFFCFYSPKRKGIVIFNYRTVIISVLISIVIGSFGSLFLTKLPHDLSLLFSPEYYSTFVVSRSIGRATYLIGLTPHSIKDLILQTPVRIVYFLYSPFPWMVSKLPDLIGFADALLYGSFTFYSLKAMMRLKKENKAILISVAMILIVFLAVFAWGTSNYGAAIRHRQKIVWLLIALTSIGISMYPKKKPSQ